MSAPLVVNTKDGVCWTRRTVTAGGIALYAPEGVCKCPEFVMATLPELAEHGIVGSADVLPMPMGREPKTVDGQRLIRAEQRTAELEAVLGTRRKDDQAEIGRLKARVAELEQLLAGKDRPSDEGPIAFTLTDKALEDCDHPNGYGPNGCGGCGALAPADVEDDVRPQVRKLRSLLAGQRAEAGERP